MLKELLEKLTRRKVEVTRSIACEWQQTVIDVADEKETDPDAVLSDLDRLGKTPEDLAWAVDLLKQRRGWAVTVAAGATAEKVRPGNLKMVEAEIAAFTKLESDHESRLAPLRETERGAVFAITEAAAARSELARTATDPGALRAVADIGHQLESLRHERAEFEISLRAKEDRYGIVAAQQDSDLDGQTARLASDVQAMRSELASFRERTEALAAEHELAHLQLLKPEAI